MLCQYRLDVLLDRGDEGVQVARRVKIAQGFHYRNVPG